MSRANFHVLDLEIWSPSAQEFIRVVTLGWIEQDLGRGCFVLLLLPTGERLVATSCRVLLPRTTEQQ